MCVLLHNRVVRPFEPGKRERMAKTVYFLPVHTYSACTVIIKEKEFELGGVNYNKEQRNYIQGNWILFELARSLS